MFRFGCFDCINCNFDRVVSIVFEIDGYGECRCEFLVDLGFCGLGFDGVLCEKVGEVLGRNDICEVVSLGV